MARLGTRQQIVLLVAAASVPVSLGITAWPPAPAVHELVVVHVPMAVPASETASIVVPPAEPAPAEPAPVEVELIEATAQPAGFVYGRDFAWVTHDVEDGAPFLVLSLAPEEAWGTGEPHATEEHGLVTREVDETAVPAELRAMVRERIVIHGGATPLCTAEVGPLRLVAQAEGEIAMMIEVPEPAEGAETPEEDGSEAFWDLPVAEQNERVAGPIWKEGRRLLVAPLATDGACDEGEMPRWARPVRRGDVERLEGTRTSKRGGPLRKFLALPELVELSQEFDDYVAQAREWALEAAASGETTPPEADLTGPLPRLRDRVKARQWKTAEGTALFVTMITEGEELEPEPCSGIPTPRWGLAPIDAEGNAGAFVAGPYGAPSAIVDLDGDGRWELLLDSGPYFSEPQLLSITPEGLTSLTTLPAVPYWGCPC